MSTRIDPAAALLVVAVGLALVGCAEVLGPAVHEKPAATEVRDGALEGRPGPSTVAAPSLGDPDEALTGYERPALDVTPASQLVVAVPPEPGAPEGDIVVEMTWDTPGDPNPTDSGAGRGTDLDLHFLHPRGDWDQAPWDCSWKDTSPNWGSSGPDDDPRLDIDDTDGWGPERVVYEDPEGTSEAPLTYSVGAFAYSDHGFGPSDVRIRVWIDGVLRLDETRAGVDNQYFWDVARITWPSRDVELIDRLYNNGFP